MVANGVTIRGSYLGSSVTGRDVPRFIELYREGLFPADQLVSHHIPLDDVNVALDRLAEVKPYGKSSSLKVMDTQRKDEMKAKVTIRRRLEWMDTDAAGIWHHATAIRWAEDAEAELHRQLGTIDRIFGATPRVNIEFDYGAPLRFGDEVDVELRVTALGDTSITYRVTVDRDDQRIATGTMVAVLIDRESGAKKRWPHDLRRVLSPPEA